MPVGASFSKIIIAKHWVLCGALSRERCGDMFSPWQPKLLANCYWVAFQPAPSLFKVNVCAEDSKKTSTKKEIINLVFCIVDFFRLINFKGVLL